MLLIGKPSRSIVHGFHGYVKSPEGKNEEFVCCVLSVMVDTTDFKRFFCKYET